MKRQFLLLFLTLSTISSFAQDSRIALFLHGGVTRPSNNFSFVGQSNDLIKEKHTLGANYGLGIQIFHKNDWFTVLSFSDFEQKSGIKVMRNDKLFARETASDTNRTPHYNLTLSLGKQYFLNKPSWSTSWITGINIGFIRKGEILYGARNGGSSIASIHFDTEKFQTGISPSLQLGGKITRYLDEGRSSISLRLLLNTGLRTHNIFSSTIDFQEQLYEATLKTKGDFIAAMVQYEVYLWRRK